MSGNLFDSTVSIAHSISSDFKLAAGIAKQVWGMFPTTYPEHGLRASEDKIYALQSCPNRLIYHLIVQPRYRNKPTYTSPRAAFEAMLQHAQKQKVEKISTPRLSTGVDKFFLVESERNPYICFPQLARNSYGLYATGTETTDSLSQQNVEKKNFKNSDETSTRR